MTSIEKLQTIELRTKWAVAWSYSAIKSGANSEKSENLAFVKQINISVNFELLRLRFGGEVADVMLFKCIGKQTL